MNIFYTYWNGILGRAVETLGQWFNLDTETAWKVTLWKVAFTAGLLLLIYEVILRIRNMIKARERRRLMAEQSVSAVPGDPTFIDKIQGAQNLDATVAQLKRAREYTRLGEVYEAVNEHRKAARWFYKGGDLKRAAMAWARAGKTVKAAKLLRKAGDHANAALLFEQAGRFLDAARLHEAQGRWSEAAINYQKAKRIPAAIAAFKQLFAQTTNPTTVPMAAAQACLDLIQAPEAQKSVNEEDRTFFLSRLAAVFESQGALDEAAKTLTTLGDHVGLARIYMKKGRLDLAAEAMKRAGKMQEAAELGGKYYESIGRWAEAGMAYEGAGNWKRAGDCFAKANDAARAAVCYEKGQEYYGAALAYVHLKKWADAIRCLQKIKEGDPHFNESRALLGRAFYEMHDYAHAAATLENHLMNERVRSENIDYFWMLALAYEQLGELEKSKSVLLKIRTVDINYRDVTQRLSNVQSRISMGAGAIGGGTAEATKVTDAAARAAAEKALGDRYEIVRELGRGGMGVVYLAQDKTLDRPVALKFLGSLLDDSPEFKERFTREARAAAKVSHPNIVHVYDVQISPSNSYIAMEYVEGINLHRYLQEKGRLSPREAVNVMIQVCSALQAVHALGIVHRDLKPENILVSKGGLIKLMDFGLAKGIGSRLTASMVVMGTPGYMSPEQVMAKDTDARTDIYALGLILFELLTGKMAFSGGDVLKRQVTERIARPSSVVPDIPVELDEIVLKCAAKEPSERYQTVEEIIAALRRVSEQLKKG
jgi:tetratricopeptide (TPR) repeat protein